MAEIPVSKSNQHLNQQLQHLESLFSALEPSPTSIARSHPQNPISFLPMRRGRNYEYYSQLRESKLRRKKSEADASKTTPKKKVSFVGGGGPLVGRNEMVVGRSVPDFSAVLRKENKKPNSEMTPPLAGGSKVGWRGGGSKSAGGGDKRGGGPGGPCGPGMLRKSCVNLKELKGMSAAAAFAIDEEGRGGRGRGMRKGVLGQRQ
ncbi:uncharacterized protein LOC131237625 [Magnolia sinica]|uniref:uncharacterized protein LOC131237625 n=1 Tax=Magnolia sinica TaxID=86752 RepID=UPI0026585C36|nr:uncharacterized protein LOC131237625 [Magnolia sinica]